MRTFGTATGLFALWLLMSGIYEPLTVGLGIVSVLVVLVVAKRMDTQDNDRLDLHLPPLRLFGYLVWLMVEIAKANWAVTKIILSRSVPIRQHLFAVPFTQKTELAQVIFANSITLTPGTITVEAEPGRFIVHAVAYSNDDPGALADMDQRVSAIETVGAG